MVLFHIAQNLLDNAEKFSREARDRTIELRLTQHDEHMVLSVADHRPGIPESFRPHLFEPFARVDHGDAPHTCLPLTAPASRHGGEAFVDTTSGL